MVISEAYRALNAKLHQQRADYGCRGGRHAERVRELLRAHRANSVLDYGAGKGGLKAALPNIDVREYDPAIPGKDRPPQPADILVCTDVLEHVEPECIADVLKQLASLTIKAGHIVVATKPDGSKKLPDGRDPHLIVESPEWWERKLSDHFRVRCEAVGKRDVTFTVWPL